MQLFCKHCNEFLTNNYKDLETVHGKAFSTFDDSNLNIKVFKYKINCCCLKSKINTSYLFNVICKHCHKEIGWKMDNVNTIKYILLEKNLTTIRT
jgi:hypothetical protein